MEFKEMFREFTSKVSSKSAEAVQKAKDMAEIASLNSQIKTEREGIKNAYIAIGEAVFNEEKDNEASVHSEPINAIKRKLDRIVDLEKQIAAIRNAEGTGSKHEPAKEAEPHAKAPEDMTQEEIAENFNDFIIKQ